MQRSMEIARLEAKISRDWDAYQQRPRRRFIGSRTQEYRFARYVEDWRQKIERIGDLNYPQGARDQRLHGRLVVTVAIKADGTVESVDINSAFGPQDPRRGGPAHRAARSAFFGVPRRHRQGHRRPAHHAHVDVSRPGTGSCPNSAPAAVALQELAREAAMPDQYAVIGNPVAHSKSPLIHAEFARQTGEDVVYVALLADARAISKPRCERFRSEGGRGLNVTRAFQASRVRARAKAQPRAQSRRSRSTR